jgi:phospholipid/cholesterol/gamma-HCH transport system permease protein
MAKLQIKNDGIYISGELTYKAISYLIDKLKNINSAVLINLENATRIDTSFAVFILEFADNYKIENILMSDKHKKLFDIVRKNMGIKSSPVKNRGFFYNLGRNVYLKLYEIYIFLGFIGEIFINISKSIANPKRLRIKAIVNDIDKMGVGAMPVVSILSFLIGVVIAYQGSIKLKEFGANIFIVDLVSISVIREFGPLIVSILLAGRSSSSYTAQIGIMKVTEEVDVIKTMGLNPFDVLVIPKILSMLISLPILTILADIMGILGGIIVAYLSMDITSYDFMIRMHHAIGIKTFFAGMIKTPVFAFLIASIGSFKGFRTKKNVNSIGNNVTVSVVDSIFAVILADAVFSILFSWFGI